MNLTDLTRALHTNPDLNLTKAQARQVIDAITDAITDELANGHDVRLPALGTFALKQRGERKIYGPIGNGKVIPAHRVVTFRPAQTLKDAVK